MIVAVSVAAVVIAILFVLFIRQSDLPYVEPISPTAHLDERKDAIYENIRDANFEFLMGKLSEQDYQQTKTDLQAELAEVNKEIAKVQESIGVPKPAESPKGKRQGKAASQKSAAAGKSETAALVESAGTSVATAAVVCPHCGASFEHAMKFCGECGQPMSEGVA